MDTRYRPCPVCRRPILGKRSDAKFCSTRCRMERWRVNAVGGGDPWAAWGVWSARRERRCERCQKPLTRPGGKAPRPDRIYCSTRCRVASLRARRVESTAA